MKNICFNPYLPSFEYIPDAEPHIFGERVYIYGSHDRFNGISFCLNDYVCWSAPVDDLSDWRYEGVIYRKKQHLGKKRGFLNSMFAPDVCQGADGRYYLYYFVGYSSRIAVAVCDTPAGSYQFLGFVRYSDGALLGSKNEPLQFDPGVFADTDNKFYLYTGFSPLNYPSFLLGGHKASDKGAMGFELDTDMLTVKSMPTFIGVPARATSKGTSFEGHEFFEASSMRKFGDTYYFIYSSFLGHELCYATSNNPLGGFEFGGTLVSIGDIGLHNFANTSNAANMTGNTHGSVIKIKDKYYVFYHRQTNYHQFSRQACVQQIFMREDGGFDQAELTSQGFGELALNGEGEYSAHTACNLWGKNGNTRFYGVIKPLFKKLPYFTQSGKDREDNPNQYIANMRSGSTAGFKYFDLSKTNQISLKIKGNAKGNIYVQTSPNSEPIAKIQILPSKSTKEFSATLQKASKKSALFFTFEGKGRFDFYSFCLKL